ncbi:hypothetical protein AB0H58_04665 [Nocardia neocaledoniensis]|uniref:hypothetical protein n=1 Tax=Nocardia neocaledoniensis TaxID=236511 RepID=UPI0033C53E37
MTSGPVTSLYDFQLSMLHAMCSSAPEKSSKLLAALGASRDDAAAAEKRWWFTGATNKFTRIAEYLDAWGTPDSERTENHSGREIRYAGWDLSFWPGLRLEWMEISGHNALLRNLLRTPGSPRPPVASVADLVPWSCTWAEFHEITLGPTDFVDGFGSIGDVASLKTLDPETGDDCLYWAHFDWGLLQSIEPRPA